MDKSREELEKEYAEATAKLEQYQQVPSRFMRKIVCRLRLSEVNRQ